MDPLVTVCVPAYNSKQYILQTLKSVVDQTYKHFELLVVDNHSSDGTIAEVKKIKDMRIRVYRNSKNFGLVGNFNRCLELAQGKYVIILGSDDLLHPDFLSKAVGVFEQDPAIGLLYTASLNIDSNGAEMSRNFPFASLHVWEGKRELLELLRRNYIAASSVLMRAECSKKVGTFNHSLPYAIDWDMWFRICQAGYKIAYIPEALAKRRYHRGSLTTYFTARDTIATDTYAVVKHILSRTHLEDDTISKALSTVSAMNLYNACFGVLLQNRKKYEHHMGLWLRILAQIEHDFGKDLKLYSATYGFLRYATDVLCSRHINPFLAKYLRFLLRQ